MGKQVEYSIIYPYIIYYGSLAVIYRINFVGIGFRFVYYVIRRTRVSSVRYNYIQYIYYIWCARYDVIYCKFVIYYDRRRDCIFY